MVFLSGAGVADRVSCDRVEPRALPAADDPDIVEKLGHVAGVAVLYSQRASLSQTRRRPDPTFCWPSSLSWPLR